MDSEELIDFKIAMPYVPITRNHPVKLSYCSELFTDSSFEAVENESG